MDNEKMLEEVYQKLKTVHRLVGAMASQLGTMETRVTSIEADLKSLHALHSEKVPTP